MSDEKDIDAAILAAFLNLVRGEIQTIYEPEDDGSNTETSDEPDITLRRWMKALETKKMSD